MPGGNTAFLVLLDVHISVVLFTAMIYIFLKCYINFLSPSLLFKARLSHNLNSKDKGKLNQIKIMSLTSLVAALSFTSVLVL